jgi:hypothetical protein
MIKGLIAESRDQAPYLVFHSGPNVAESEPHLRSSGAIRNGRTDTATTFRRAPVIRMTKCLR